MLSKVEVPSGHCRPTVLPTPKVPKSHSHGPSWASSRNRVLTPGMAVRCRGPQGPSFFHQVGTLTAPSGLRTRGAPWRCFPQVCWPPEVRGAPHLRDLTRVWPPPLREPPLLPAKGSWRGCRSSKRAGLFEETSGRPLRGSSGPPREKDEPPTGTGSFNSLTPFSGSPGSR